MDGTGSMMRRILISFFSVLALAGVASAMRSSDAKAREPQLRAHYQQVRDDYETKQVERQAEIVRANERTKAEIFTPPWMREAESGIQSGADLAAKAAADKAHKRNHRIFISIVLLILISSVAGWARYATREHDG
jgi:uncharacterized protein YceK